MKQKPEHHRQQFARQSIAVLLLALLLTGCGTSKELRRYAMMPALEKRPTTSKASTSGNARTRYSSSDMNYNPPPPFYGTSTTFAASRVYIDPQYHFGDINSTQLSAARKYGITPLANRQEAAESVGSLCRVGDNAYYTLAPMSHSVPYLTPGAASLLSLIGQRFQQELAKSGYRKHRIVVTSLLRTEADVQRLQRTNSNATRNSCHMYATTFDLSYVRFNRIDTSGSSVDNNTMANILGRVLNELRDSGLCYVKYETQQRCYHITSRR